MVDGPSGENMVLVVRPVKVDTVPDIDTVPSQHQRTVVLIVLEWVMKHRIVEVMSIALLMDSGENGVHIQSALKLVAMESDPEVENVLHHCTVERNALALIKKQPDVKSTNAQVGFYKT